MNNRIAVCFSGQIRTGVEASPSILQYLGDMLPDIDFFIHTWDIETISKWGLNGRSRDIADVPFNANPEKFVKMKEIYQPKIIKVDNFELYNDNRYKLAGPGYVSHPLFQSVNECNNLKKNYEDANNFKYKLVLRLRPDILFDNQLRFIDEVNYIGDNQPNNGKIDVFYVNDQWNKCPQEIEDICWLSSSATMDIASGFGPLRELPGMYRDINWQRHHKIYLGSNGIISRPFKYNGFYIYRDYLLEQGIGPFDIDLIKKFTTY